MKLLFAIVVLVLVIIFQDEIFDSEFTVDVKKTFSTHQELSGQSVRSGLVGGEIEIVYLPDGTKCAVWSSQSGGGISCNWVNASGVDSNSKAM